jgi:hypothetical protein
MASSVEIGAGTTEVRRFPRALRRHAVLGAVIVGVLLGGGLRFLPTGADAASGSNAPDQGAASTACAAQ